MELKIIAQVRTDFPAKFGLPRQSGLVEELCGKIVFEPLYQKPEALRGLEGYSHLWIIWGFSERFVSGKSDSGENDWSPTVRPPRLGGNKRVGVFATRSPNRPNKIGLSCVKIQRIDYDESVIYVAGIDMMDGTPVYDIKPYLPYADSHPEASGGFAAEHIEDNLNVKIPEELLADIPEEKRGALRKVLEQDPRPSYHHDDTREYGFPFAGLEIKFSVSGNTLKVHKVEKQIDLQ